MVSRDRRASAKAVSKSRSSGRPGRTAARRAPVLNPPSLRLGMGYHHATPYQIVTPIGLGPSDTRVNFGSGEVAMKSRRSCVILDCTVRRSGPAPRQRPAWRSPARSTYAGDVVPELRRTRTDHNDRSNQGVLPFENSPEQAAG
jgi:hypothetical protein